MDIERHWNTFFGMAPACGGADSSCPGSHASHAQTHQSDEVTYYDGLVTC